jgi:hypothetical protein
MLNHSFHTPRIGVGRILIDGARDLLAGGARMDHFPDANGNTEVVTSTRDLQVTEDRCTTGGKIRCRSPPLAFTRGRKPFCPRIKKPLFCKGLRSSGG